MSNEQSSAFGRFVRPILGAAVAAALIALSLVVPALAVAGPTKLSDPDVTPRTAAPGTTVTFSVTYRNREGSPPDEVRVTIGGSTHHMAAAPDDSNWKAGVRFTFATSLPVGVHPVAFSGTDRERFTDEIDGGTVTIGTPSSLTSAPPASTPTPPPATPGPTGSPAPTPRPTLPADRSPTTAGPAPMPPGKAPLTPTPTTTTDSPRVPHDDLAPGRDGPDRAAMEPDGPPAGADDDGEAAGEAGLPAPSDPPADPPGGSEAEEGSGDVRTGGTGSGRRGGDVIAVGTWGAFANAFEALGVDPGRSALLKLLPTVVTSAGGVTLLMAFMFFGKKRRDGEPPAPDEVLEARAARGDDLPPAASLVPDEPRPAPEAEMQMPRWRRPSLLEARKKDPLRDAGRPAPPLTFDHGLVGAGDGAERRLIRYNVVRLLDAPDELRSAEIGFLDQGDEVQLLERSGAYWLVLCPDGRRGWLHRMTLGDAVGAPRSPGPQETWAAPTADEADPAIDDDVLAAFLSARGRA